MNKKEYREQREYAEAVGIYSAALKVNPLEYGYNGLAVAWRVVRPDIDDPRMLQVAVSYCAVEDVFKRRIGRDNAINNVYVGNYVQLPLAQLPNEELGEILLNIFNV